MNPAPYQEFPLTDLLTTGALVIELSNGRVYRLTDAGEYIHGEYPEGGIKICTWDARLNEGNGGWMYVDNSPDVECVRNFLHAASRLPPLPAAQPEQQT